MILRVPDSSFTKEFPKGRVSDNQILCSVVLVLCLVLNSLLLFCNGGISSRYVRRFEGTSLSRGKITVPFNILTYLLVMHPLQSNTKLFKIKPEQDQQNINHSLDTIYFLVYPKKDLRYVCLASFINNWSPWERPPTNKPACPLVGYSCNVLSLFLSQNHAQDPLANKNQWDITCKKRLD